MRSLRGKPPDAEAHSVIDRPPREDACSEGKDRAQNWARSRQLWLWDDDDKRAAVPSYACR